MKRIKYFIALVASIILSNILSGQDIHFSQYNNAPLSINPANTSAFNMDYRAIINYKSQWKSIKNAYETYSFTYDRGFFKKEIHGGYLGVGINLMQDVAGETRFTTSNASLSIAYHLPLSKYQYLGGAIQAGALQQSIDESKFKWDNQYVGPAGFDQTLPSGENIKFENIVVGDLAAGILWRYTGKETYMSANDGVSANVGLSGYHLNRPFMSFYNAKTNRLLPRYVLHSNAVIGVYNSNLVVIPSGILMFQGKHKEIIGGALLKYNIKEKSRYSYYSNTTSLAIGGSYRVKDAFIIETLFEFAGFVLGVSYDINISKLKIATHGRGGLELSLCYKAFKKQSVSKY
jgi:type IX secretion system PorP/SprF family membrane protein